VTASPEPFADAIRRLEEAWDFPDGVLFRLRQGEYDPSGIDDLVKLLKSLSLDEDCLLPRRFVSLTWWMPMFMEWQKDRVAEEGGDVEALERDAVRVRNVLDELLGVP
jgi:hypothetical protein